MIEHMDWYRVFYHTAKAGSLSKAAEELYITQPAVTHTIKQLEAKLGGQLFFRTPRGVRLTAEGEVLLTYIEQAYHLIANGERKLAELHQLTSGEITIGAGDTLCRHVLLPHLERFHDLYPDVKIRVTNRTSLETVELLKQGRIDLGIVNLPLHDKGIKLRECGTVQDCFVVGDKYRHLADSPWSWESFLSCPLILLEEGSSSRAYIDRYLQAQGVYVKPELELGSIELLMEYARAGFGAACVVKDFIRQELTDGSLVELPLEPPIPPRSIGIATLSDVPLSAAAKKFIEMIG
jgi:LysR family transcriptional regulator, cyn operon transcriptional activator